MLKLPDQLLDPRGASCLAEVHSGRALGAASLRAMSDR